MLKEYLETDIKLNKKQMICVICLIIIASGIFGWVYEFIWYYINSGFKTFYMRGSNYLPWINIYAYGSFLILFLCYKRRKHPFQVFLISIISTGILEYFSGLILYDILGWTRCWSYNEEIWNFGNIGGFVCLRSVLFFGLSGLLLIYGMVPFFINISRKDKNNILFIISIILCSIILIDELHNLVLFRIDHLPRARDVYKTIGFKYIYFTK